MISRMRRASGALVLAALVSALPTGSADARSDDTNVHAQLVGGAPADPGEYPSATLVIVVHDDKTSGLCTGTLIAPTWVLTAAHCLMGSTGSHALADGTTGKTWVRVGATTTSSGTLIAATRIVVHPGYRPDVAMKTGFDAGLVQLAQPATATPTRPMTVGEFGALPESLVSTIVGWGNTDPKATADSTFINDPFVLREASLMVDFLSDRIAVASSGTAKGCYGDSGGPLFVTDGSGERRVLGVTKGITSCNPADDGFTFFASAAGQLDWIAQVVGDAALGIEVGSGPAAASRFLATSPVRLADTRSGLGSMGPGEELQVPLTTAPAGATAVAANITVVGATEGGVVKARSCDRPPGSTITLSYDSPRATPNLAVVPVDGDRRLCITSSATAHVIVDLAGWYAPSGGDGYNPVVPTRLLDTRTGPDPRGAPRRLAAGEVLRLPVRGAGGVAPDATSVLVNVTAVAPSADGFITAYPCDRPRPNASNLNPSRGQIVANQATVAIAADGSICLFSYSDTDLVIDVAGYFAPTGASFFSLGGTRVTDTIGGEFEPTPVLPGTPWRVNLDQFRGLPAGITSVTLDLSVGGLGDGYLTAYPCDQPRPTASNVNFVTDSLVTNLATVPVAADGSVCIFSFAPSLLIVDLVGWYA